MERYSIMDISVIVPIFRGNKYIPSIMEMVDRNTRYASTNRMPLNVELLLLNDYPKEELSISRGKVYNYESVIIVNSENSGIHQTRVNGLNKSRGKYILFLDQDDEITDNCLYSQYRAIGDGDIVVGNGYRGIKGNYRRIYRNMRKQQLVKNETIYLKAANQIVSPGHCLIRKAAIPKEWYNSIIRDNGGDDLFLWLLMFENNCKFVINPECIYKHIDTGMNLSSDFDTMYKSSENIIRTARNCGSVDNKKINIYERRVSFSKQMRIAQGLKRLIVALKNSDIVMAKLLAYYYR